MRVKWRSSQTGAAGSDSPYQYSDVHGYVSGPKEIVQAIVTFNGRLLALPVGWLEVVGEEE